MKFAGRQKAQVLNDVVTVPDPWGFGMVFGIRRKQSSAHQAWVRKQQRDNPVMANMLAGLARGTLIELARNERNMTDEQREAMRARKLEVIESQVEKLELSPDQIEQMFRANFQEAEVLLVSWAGDGMVDPDTGELNECNAANKRALLEDDSVIPLGAGLRNEGQLLGESLIDFIHETAEAQDGDRQKFLVEAGKGSGDGSAGTSVPGQTIPSSAGA